MESSLSIEVAKADFLIKNLKLKRINSPKKGTCGFIKGSIASGFILDEGWKQILQKRPVTGSLMF